MLTQLGLKKYLRYNADTGVFNWIKSISRKTKVGNNAGTLRPDGYIHIGIKGSNYLAHRLAWLYMTGKWPDNNIDHINHIRDDNRRGNLREATYRDNNRNRSPNKISESGVTGVSRTKAKNAWWARIKIDGETIYLGTYNSKKEAAAARKTAEAKYGFHENHGKRVGCSDGL